MTEKRIESLGAWRFSCCIMISMTLFMLVLPCPNRSNGNIVAAARLVAEAKEFLRKLRLFDSIISYIGFFGISLILLSRSDLNFLALKGLSRDMFSNWLSSNFDSSQNQKFQE